MRIRIVKDWEQPDIFRQTPGGRGIWDNIEFTEKRTFDNDALIVLNAASHNIFTRCRKGGLWLMSQEPPHPFYSWQIGAYKYFDRIYSFWDKSKYPGFHILNTQTSLPWHIKKSYDELMQIKNPHLLNKHDKVCWITSNLNSRPGHSIRLKFLEFLKENKFDFDLYGRGFKEIDDKFSVLESAKYGIAIENFSCPDYWTEKIADCFLSWTMPIYFGCTNISEYFPEESIIKINPEEPENAIRIIRESINNGLWEKRLSVISEARQLILNKYQFFPAIAEKIRKATLGRKKTYWIPRL